ncbi:MAG: hypothetical protein JNG89_06755, partial [Planctomycetaceae bacterium]|nr:hypothetical protein [Planctomycetaceae bacterium]
ITTHQLNREHDYASGARNQIELYESLGLFDAPLDKRPSEMPKLTALADETASLDVRARSYLHANCSYCHVPAGGGNSAVDFEITALPEKSLLVDASPVHTNFGIDGARVVSPGSPARSIVLHRIGLRGRGQMPPLATSVVDEQAIAVIRNWIAQLPAAAD